MLLFSNAMFYFCSTSLTGSGSGCLSSYTYKCQHSMAFAYW